MPPKVHKLGPGLLTLGETASEQEFGSQCTRVAVEPSWGDEDPISVLSGDEYSEPGEFEGTLTGEFLQEFSMASLIAWCKANSGTVLPFLVGGAAALAGSFAGNGWRESDAARRAPLADRPDDHA